MENRIKVVLIDNRGVEVKKISGENLRNNQVFARNNILYD